MSSVDGSVRPASRPMKIVYLARRPIPSVNAHSVQIVKMSEAFGKLGHDVLLLANGGDDDARHVYGRYGVDATFSIECFPEYVQVVSAEVALRRPPASSSASARPICFSAATSSPLPSPHGWGNPSSSKRTPSRPTAPLRWRMLQLLFSSKNFSHLVCVTSTLAETYGPA